MVTSAGKPEHRNSGLGLDVVGVIAAVVLPAMLAGCASIGPATMPEDRLAYTLAVAKSLEEQLLLNIVRTRYSEAPTFVDVSQIVAGYEFVREGSLSSEYHPQGSPDSFVGLGAALRLTEKPTISYAPLSGEAFSRALVVPVPPHMVLLLIQAGWGADGVLNLCARSINGYHNRLPRVGGAIEADPEFSRIALLLRQVQDAGAVDFQVREDEGKKRSIFLTVRASRNSEAETELDELRRILHIDNKQSEIPIGVGLLEPPPGELTLYTFSMMQMLMAQGHHVTMPPDVTIGVVDNAKEGAGPVMAVKSGKTRPATAAVAVPYAGNWFWIERDDPPSRATLMALAILYRLLESGTPSNLPVLTIPAG